MKNRCKYLILFILPVLTIYQASGQETNFATNVNKSLSVDGKGLTIEYDIVFPDTAQLFDIILKIDNKGTLILPLEKDLHGDWGTRVKPGTGKIIMWDFPNGFKANIKDIKVDLTALKTTGPAAVFDFKILTTKPPFNVRFINKSKNADKYSWNFGDPKSRVNNLSNTDSPDHAFKSGGTYNVNLAAYNSATKMRDSTSKVVKLGSGNTQEIQKIKKQKDIWIGSAIATAGIGGICLLKQNSVYNDWKEKGTSDLKTKYKTYETIGVVALVGSGVCITQVILKSIKLKQAKNAMGMSYIPIERGGIVEIAWTF